MPGFGPAAEVLLVRQKDPTTVALFETYHTQTPRPASSDGRTQTTGGHANSLRSDKARRFMRASTHGAGRQASGRRKWRVAELREIRVAFHRLDWVFTGVHRSVSKDGMTPRGEYFGNYLE